MDLLQVKEQIKSGLIKAYKQNLLLLSSYSEFSEQVREYLLTVNVAQQLLEWNERHLYKIQLEYPVLYFYSNAFLSHEIEAKDIFNMILLQRQPGHSPTEKLHQKIDIAITQEQSTNSLSYEQERSLCGIELKAINKNEIEIIGDARRLSNAMILTDNISPNSIEFCFSAFLRRFDKSEIMVTENFIHDKSTDQQNHWNSICNILAGEFPSLDFAVEQFDVASTPLETIADIHKQMESDYSEVAIETGIVVGYLMSITRKNLVSQSTVVHGSNESLITP